MQAWAHEYPDPESRKTANFYKADFEGYYFGMMGLWSGPNMGEFSEPVQLKENKGVIALREDDYIHCDISLAVVPNGWICRPTSLNSAGSGITSAPAGTICEWNNTIYSPLRRGYNSRPKFMGSPQPPHLVRRI
jgi:hypothetical protein